MDGKIFLNGNQYGGAQLYELTPPAQHFHVTGQLIKGEDDPIAAIGCADIILNNGLATVNFAVQFTTQGSSNINFKWGVSSELIHTLNSNIPLITPVKGGFWDTYSYNYTLIDYAPSFDIQENLLYWIPGRYYTSSLSNLGWWPANQFSSGTHIHGTCYGTYDLSELERGRIINGDNIMY